MTVTAPQVRIPEDEPTSLFMPTRLDRPSTSAALADELRRQILSGRIPAGTRLREAEIAEAFRVSRQSLRAALAELVHEGILRHAPNRGVWVPMLSADDIRDVFDMRGLVEGEAAARIAKRPALAAPVWLALERLDRLAAESDTPGFGEAHTAFHQALVDAVSSPRLSRTYQQLRSECALSLIASRTAPCATPAGQAASHRALLEAIVAGPPQVARKAAIAHLTSGLKSALEAAAEAETWRIPAPRESERPGR